MWQRFNKINLTFSENSIQKLDGSTLLDQPKSQPGVIDSIKEIDQEVMWIRTFSTKDYFNNSIQSSNSTTRIKRTS